MHWKAIETNSSATHLNRNHENWSVFNRVSYYCKHNNNNQFEETTTTNNKTNTMDAASWHNLVDDVIVSNLNLFL